jgi:hypothetical protein
MDEQHNATAIRLKQQQEEIQRKIDQANREREIAQQRKIQESKAHILDDSDLEDRGDSQVSHSAEKYYGQLSSTGADMRYKDFDDEEDEDSYNNSAYQQAMSSTNDNEIHEESSYRYTDCYAATDGDVTYMVMEPVSDEEDDI